MILYNLRKTSDGFILAKFGPDFNVEAVYHLANIRGQYQSKGTVHQWTCDCPAGHRPSCKHRKMLPRMIPKADTDSFYCYETQSWHKPLAPQGEEPMQDKLDAFYATIEKVTNLASVEPADWQAIQNAVQEPIVKAVEVMIKKHHNPPATVPPTLRRRV